jgi:hypothetical protein
MNPFTQQKCPPTDLVELPDLKEEVRVWSEKYLAERKALRAGEVVEEDEDEEDEEEDDRREAPQPSPPVTRSRSKLLKGK